MNQPVKLNNITVLADYLMLFVVMGMPFYSVRLSIFGMSFSILTISCIIANLLFLSIYRNLLRPAFYSDPLWIYALLFLIAFVPSLLLYPSVHAIGVFVEWLSVPITTSFLLSLHISHRTSSKQNLIYSIIVSLLVVIIVALIYLICGNTTFDNRLTAHYLSPNHLAMYIAPLIFITGTLFYQKNRIFHFSASIIISCALFVLFLTHSFNTAIALSIVTLIIIFILTKRKVVMFVVIGCVFFALSFVGYHKLLLTNPDFSHNSFASRLTIWRASTLLIQTGPFYGYEIDSFQSHYLTAQKFFPPYPDWAVPTPHNLAFTLLFSGGFFTLLCFMVIVFRVIYLLFFLHRAKKSRLGVFFGAAFLIIVLSGIADTPYWKNDLALVFWLITALIVSQSSTLTHSSDIQYQ